MASDGFPAASPQESLNQSMLASNPPAAATRARPPISCVAPPMSTIADSKVLARTRSWRTSASYTMVMPSDVAAR
jgi:hypothetical protein